MNKPENHSSVRRVRIEQEKLYLSCPELPIKGQLKLITAHISMLL